MRLGNPDLDFEIRISDFEIEREIRLIRKRISPTRNLFSGWISIRKSKSGFHRFPFYRSIGKSEKGFAKLLSWTAVFFLLIVSVRARLLFLRTVFQINFFGFPNRTIKTQIQKQISQRRNPFSDFAYDCRYEMRILKSKSRFPNRKHPKNKHAFFPRSFVLVVCLFVVCLHFVFFSIATDHSPPQRFSHALLDFRYAKWVQARKQNIFAPALTRAMPLSLSPYLFEPLWRREAASSPWAVCLHKCFWEELILILIFPFLIFFSYRVLAVDHDLISFVDVQLNTWPVVLITNPKDAHYIMRPHEPLGRMRKSTHIRSLEYQFSRTTVISHKLLEHFSNSLLFSCQKGRVLIQDW